MLHRRAGGHRPSGRERVGSLCVLATPGNSSSLLARDLNGNRSSQTSLEAADLKEQGLRHKRFAFPIPVGPGALSVVSEASLLSNRSRAINHPLPCEGEQRIVDSLTGVLLLPVMCSRPTAKQPFDLIYCLDPGQENRGELGERETLSYLHQPSAIVHVSVQQKIEAVPPGVVPLLALVGAAREKRKIDSPDTLPVIHQQALFLDQGGAERWLRLGLQLVKAAPSSTGTLRY